MRRAAVVAALVAMGWVAAAPALAAPLLPDMIVWASEQKQYMYGATYDLDAQPGRVLYRFDGALPNIGQGPLEIFEITYPNDMQDVFQNIYDPAAPGGFTQTYIGTFSVENLPFGHLNLENIAQYSIRKITPGDGVGEIVATQFKDSHALVDSAAYDTSLPGAPGTRHYTSTSANPLGVSIGWADVYSRSIPQQWIDITGVPAGRYWFEVVADPTNIIQELNESNNTTRIMVDLGIPGDADGDGDVDADDLAIISVNFGQPGGYGEGDHDGDGVVTLSDYDIAALNYGQSLDESVTPLPEPGVMALVAVLGSAATSLVRRRHT